MNMTASMKSSDQAPALTHDQWILALTLWRECRGESTRGKVAAAEVIVERVRDPRWPDTICGVCLQPWQFSCFNSKDPNATKLPGPDDLVFPSCQDIALFVTGGDNRKEYFIDKEVKGSNHYLASWMKNSNKLPKWAQGKKFVQVGSHLFYKL